MFEMCLFLFFFSVRLLSLERKCISSLYFNSWHLSAIRSWWHILESMTYCLTFMSLQTNNRLCIYSIMVCIMFCRRLLVEKCISSNFLRRVGKQQFVIQMNVLDLVYSQTVTWVGVFYCPLLPAISICKLVAIFYISKVCPYCVLLAIYDL